MSQNPDLIKTYSDSLLMQYVGKPKAYATIEAFVNSCMIADLALSVRDGYNIETAIGHQLDILGKYAGIGRTIYGFNAAISYFGYLVYGETPPKSRIVPYMVYGETPTGGRSRRYVENDIAIFIMLDDQFRLMLKLRFYKNLSNGSAYDISQILDSTFGTRYLSFDNNMHVIYFFQTSDSLLVQIAKFLGLLPRPTGVGIEVHFVPDAQHIFGYNVYGSTPPAWMVGYSIYGTTPIGGMATYG
jgi:hypothetical protein